jgi:hypothetical protein
MSANLAIARVISLASRGDNGRPFSSDQLIELQVLILALYIDAANTLSEQQALDAIDVSRPFTDQPVGLVVRAPEILLADTGNANHGGRATS